MHEGVKQPLHHEQLQKTMHTIPPNVYRACESEGVTQMKSACEPVGMTQETHDHNYFRTRSVVNKVHPLSNWFCPSVRLSVCQFVQ